MAIPPAKRRKIEHASSDEEGSTSSFAGFGSDHDADKALPMSAAAPKKTENGKPGAPPRAQGGAYVPGTSKSSVFKLRVDELLAQIRPKHGKRDVEEALRTVKSSIERIPDKEPLSVEDAQKGLLTSSKVAVPFPYPIPRSDAKYRLAYARPASINVLGSYALETASRTKKVLEIDLVVTMPSSLFQEKDYLNHRYFYKRAYYLACIAVGLQSAHQEDLHLRYERFRDDLLKPVLVITPKPTNAADSSAKLRSKWQINVIPCVAEDAFAAEKLLPSKNCARDQPDSVATGFYNSSLRSDMLMSSHAKLAHTALKMGDAVRDACMLGATWLQQRGLGSHISTGGFGAFEWSALVALLLQVGGPSGKPILSDRYSSYQLLKATLQVLAVRDWIKQPHVVGAHDLAPTVPGNTSPMIWDVERSHNLLYKMTPWSYKKLREEARTTLKMLNDATFDGFDAMFIQRVDNPLYKYDYAIEVPDSAVQLFPQMRGYQALDKYTKLYEVLQRGLGDRVQHMDIFCDDHEAWAVGTQAPRTIRMLTVGLVVNPETVNRTADHGPAADQKEQAAAFRKFWGNKSELRRFKDGTILETVVWNVSDNRTILELIVSHLLERHLGDAAAEDFTFAGGDVGKLLAHGSAMAQFAPTMEAFKQFETDVRGLDGLPLTIRQISPADARLRYASKEPLTKSRRPEPANVVLQFEGSARWPDDLVAIQRTKIAFLLKISDMISEAVDGATPRIGLENESCEILNQAYLDVSYEGGAAFRVRIHHDREQTLLEKALKHKTLEPSAKDAAVLGLAMYKRDYIKAPAHTQAFAGLCSRYPALSGTTRLLKQWFASHLLANHIAEEVIELMAAKTFVQPWPWQAPSSVQTGFYRTLNWLARLDWRNDPLIVDLSVGGDLKHGDVQSMATKLEAWRTLDPALNRLVLFAASNVDVDGTTWTDGRPTKVIAGRMSGLAKAARVAIENHLPESSAALFSSSHSDFDFVIHLDPSMTHKKRKGEAVFKNLELEQDVSGYNPVMGYTTELERLYGSAIVFFAGGQERAIIAGLWNPQTLPRPWTLHLAYSTTPHGISSDGDSAISDVASEKRLDVAGKPKAQAKLNHEAILAEIAILGGDMVRKIEVHRH